MAIRTRRAGEQRFSKKLRDFLHKARNAEEVGQAEGDSHSSLEELKPSASPKLAERDRNGGCDPSDASETTGVEEGTTFPEDSEQSQREKLLSLLREAQQKIRAFGGKTKTFLQRIGDKLKDRFSESGSPSEGPERDPLGENASLVFSVQMEETLVRAETPIGEKACAQSQGNMFEDASEEVTEVVDISGLQNKEAAPNVVTIVCTPADMDPEMFGYFRRGMSISETKIDGNKVILDFCASSLEEVANAIHFEDLRYQ